jgi:ubiquinone/menaquinone biosynthesis C-methylase UbiE
MPIKDSFFDIVLSFDVLEHIPDVDAHLSEVRRVLKPGGFYLFQTPNKLTNVPFEILKNRSLTKHKTYHCSLQTFWSLKGLLVTHGFEFRFIKIPVMNEFMERKVARVLGRAGGMLMRIVDVDRLPLPIRTNFYVEGRAKI